MRLILGVATLGGLVYVVLLLTLLFGPENSATGYAPPQPVAYSHALHAGKLDLDCRYCHDTVERSARAALPPASTCMNCHSSVRTTSDELAPIRRAFETGEPVRWVRVHDLPDFVYFDHSVHLNAGVGCTSCHGRVDRMEVVRQSEALTMGWCLDCHRDPGERLRPREEITNMAWTRANLPPGETFDAVEEYGVKPATDCSTCHR